MSAPPTPEQVNQAVRAVREFWRQPKAERASADARPAVSGQIG